jgi:hypothetical protein
MTRRGRPERPTQPTKIKHGDELTIEQITFLFESTGRLNPYVNPKGYAHPMMSIAITSPNIEASMNKYFTGRTQENTASRLNRWPRWVCTDRYDIRRNLRLMLKYSKLESFKEKVETVLELLKDLPEEKTAQEIAEENAREWEEMRLNLHLTEGIAPPPSRKGKRGPTPKLERPEYWYKKIVPYNKTSDY